MASRTQPARAILFGIGLLFSSALTPNSVTAQKPDQGVAAGRPIEPPRHLAGTSVKVSLGVYLLQLSNLNELAQTFDVEGYLSAHWKDPRLAFDSTKFGAPKKAYQDARALDKMSVDIWWPSIEFVNAGGGGGALDRHWLEVSADGSVNYTARYNATVTSTMDLRKFPYDTQVLRIPLESYFYVYDDVQFVQDSGSTGYNPEHYLLEWSVQKVATKIDRHDYSMYGPFFGAYSRFMFELTLKRQSDFYLWKIFLPLLLIVASSWTVFWIRDLAVNVGISFTILLTVVAFNFSIAGTLPRVPYLTFMDAILSVSYISVFLSLIVIMVANRFEERSMEGKEEQLKRVSRWAFPLGLTVSVGVLALWFLR